MSLHDKAFHREFALQKERPWRGSVVQIAQGMLEVRYEDGSLRRVAAHDAHAPAR